MTFDVDALTAGISERSAARIQEVAEATRISGGDDADFLQLLYRDQLPSERQSVSRPWYDADREAVANRAVDSLKGSSIYVEDDFADGEEDPDGAYSVVQDTRDGEVLLDDMWASLVNLRWSR